MPPLAQAAVRGSDVRSADSPPQIALRGSLRQIAPTGSCRLSSAAEARSRTSSEMPLFAVFMRARAHPRTSTPHEAGDPAPPTIARRAFPHPPMPLGNREPSIGCGGHSGLGRSLVAVTGARSSQQIPRCGGGGRLSRAPCSLRRRPGSIERLESLPTSPHRPRPLRSVLSRKKNGLLGPESLPSPGPGSASHEA